MGSPPAGDEGRGTEAPSLPSATPEEATLALERGAPFAWPDLDAAPYGDASAAPERATLKAWRAGAPTLAAPAVHGTPAALYLAADVTYLRTLVGRDEPLAAPRAYERALRAAPGFADAPRALLMLGLANLRLGLAPEADLAFERLAREHPESPWVPAATVARARALRARGRFDDARALLVPLADGGPAAQRCDVLVEQAAIARAARVPVRALAAEEALVRDCPQLDGTRAVIEGRADTLLALGRRGEARALLAAPPAGLAPQDAARLLVRAADLAVEDGDLEAGRGALERALGLRLGAEARVVAQARLARIDAAVGPERALERLAGLRTAAPTRAARLEVIGVEAETLADLGRFEAALARLGRAEVDGGEEAPVLRDHRQQVLARWVAERREASDAPGIVAVYAAHRVTIDGGASSETALAVGEALARVGLQAAGLRVLRLRQPPDDPSYALALAEAAIAARDPATARQALSRAVASVLPADQDARRARLATRLAIAEGDLEQVPPGAAADPLVAGELASAWLARADAAITREAWGDAAAASARAAVLAGDPLAQAQAAAGRVLASAAMGDALPPALEPLGALGDPVVRRGAELLAATRPFGAPAPASGARTTTAEGAHAR